VHATVEQTGKHTFFGRTATLLQSVDSLGSLQRVLMRVVTVLLVRLAAMSPRRQCAVVSCMVAPARARAAAALATLTACHRHGVIAARHLRQSLPVCGCAGACGGGACWVARPAGGRREDVPKTRGRHSASPRIRETL